MTKLIFLAGSIRKNSFNQRLAKNAAALAETMNAEVEVIDLTDYDMPLFNEDLEAEDGLPEAAIRLKKKFQGCDGFFLACPEYNSSITPLLKNTLDWISRKHEDNEPPLSAFKGKVAGLGATSQGALGGLRGLVVVRMLLSNIGVHVCPTQVAVKNANDAFDGDSLTDETSMKLLQSTISELVETSKALNA